VQCVPHSFRRDNTITSAIADKPPPQPRAPIIVTNKLLHTIYIFTAFIKHVYDYTSHVTRIMWNGVFSERFLVKNGVKQGGVLSPVLFYIYIDGLLERLARSQTGRTVDAVYVGALAYADDILVLAPTPSDMRLLLQICDNYAKEYNITFNASKSNCMYIPPYKCRAF